MPLESIVLVVLILLSGAAFFFPVRKRYEIIRSVPGSFEVSGPERRFIRFVWEVCLQGKVISQRPFAGLMHAFVFWGFAAFGLVTLDHFCRGGFGFPLLGHGGLYGFFRGAAVIFAVAVLIGINALAIRRFILRPKALGDHVSWTSGLVALFINVLMITYLAEYCSAAAGKEFAGKVPAILGFPFHPYEEGNAFFVEGALGSTVNWWLHSVVILAFMALIPQSKHLHLVLGPFATYFKSFELAPIKPLDFEKEEFGAESLKDLGKFTALSAFSCVECGRCFDNCPASQTDKTLNPKELILDLRAGFLKGVDTPVAGETLDEKTIWQCTTCGSCTWQCPVGVEHVSPIIETRRGLAAGGEFPPPLKTMFKSMERHKNPWGYTQDQAEEFLDENEYPKFKDQDVLYWMGCLARYDDAYRKSSLAFKRKLDDAGVSWGVFYDEKCTGDAARRAGNEFVFQEIAEGNIEKLNAAAPRKVVTTCPHCLRTLKEYGDLGLDGKIEIVHHSAFLKDLAAAGKLGGGERKRAVFHDACYLSRYTGPAGHRNPREFLKSRGIDLIEPPRTRERSFCCGAGGAQFFNEEDEGKKIYQERTDELLELKPDAIITACPFCQAMIRDGLADRGVEDVSVLDLSQV